MPTEPAETTDERDDQDPPTGDSEATDLEYANAAPVVVSNAPAGRLDWAVICIRLGALWCFFSTIPAVFAIPLLFDDSRVFSWSDRAITLAPYAIFAFMGIMLWTMALSLSRRMLADVPAVGSSPPETPATASSRSEAQAIAFSVVGVVFTVLALRRLPEAFQALSRRSQYDGTSSGSVDRVILINFALELACGLLLFFGSRGLANLWRRSTRRHDEPEDQALQQDTDRIDSGPQDR
jgi:hypothetical protein